MKQKKPLDFNWHGRKVLVTGADGFIGSHLTERLVELGTDVRAFCLYNSNGSWGWLDESPDSVKSQLDVVLGDIRDARFVEVACNGVDTVFHLAALIAIPYSYQAPESFIDTNVRGTLNVLEATRRAGCRRMVQTSTSEVYGTPASLPIRESHPLKGQSPYSASKIGADKLCESFFCSFELPVVTLRPFNTYGPRQSTRAVLPTILTQLLAGKQKVELGNLTPRRDLTFVSDTVEGFIRAASTPKAEGEVIQLGTNHAISIGELFQVCCQACEVKAEVVQSKKRFRPSRGEVQVLQSDYAKAKDILKWEPETSLKDGLRQTAQWLTERITDYDVERYHR